MSRTARPRRSALYLPASNARAIEKARTLSCDVVILDLEDAVAPEAKALAREQAVGAVRQGGFGARELVVRVNGLATPWGAADLAALSETAPDAVLVPKVAGPGDLAAYADLPGRAPLWVMIETCAAVLALEPLGRACAEHGVAAWVMGVNDLAGEMGCRLDAARSPLAPALSLSVMAARANGLAILDGVFNRLADAQGLAAECAQGAGFGFDGKTLIHPDQIAAANQAFSPTPEAIRWARTVTRAFAAPEAAGQGVIRLEGQMVERLHLAQAQALLGVADAIAAREAS